jgi:hypothetical protein
MRRAAEMIAGALLLALVAGAIAQAQSNRYPSTGKGGGGSAASTVTTVATTAVVVSSSGYKTARYGGTVFRSGAGSGSGAATETDGARFYVTIEGSKVAGANFWWFPATSRTIRCSLWDVDSSARLAMVDVPTTGTGAYTCTFPTAVTVAPYHRYDVTMRSLTTDYSYFNTSSIPEVVPTFPQFQLNFVWVSWAVYNNNDAAPNATATTEKHPIEPIFTVGS